MMDDYLKLKREHDQNVREKDKTDGALDQVMDEIKERFGCQTIDEAKAELERMTIRRTKMTKKYLKAKAAYEKSLKRPAT